MVDPYLYIKRAMIIVVAIIIMGLGVRPFLIPASFGQYGEFRGDHLYEEQARDPIHQGSDVCAGCHDENAGAIADGGHAKVPCETCHFQPYAGDENHPNAHPEVTNAPDRSRDACAICHQYLFSRPEGFPRQEDMALHMENNGADPTDSEIGCIECHNPHSPGM